METETMLSLVAVVVATFSAAFSLWTWCQSNRPVLAAVVKTAKPGNQAIAYELVVANVGSRPAVDVRMECDRDGLRRALTDPEAKFVEQATRCFEAKSVYPLIVDGESVTHAFGVTARNPGDGTWNYGARFRVTLTYKGLGTWRWWPYKSSLDVAIIDSDSFAGSSWGEPNAERNG